MSLGGNGQSVNVKHANVFPVCANLNAVNLDVSVPVKCVSKAPGVFLHHAQTTPFCLKVAKESFPTLGAPLAQSTLCLSHYSQTDRVLGQGSSSLHKPVRK